MLEAGKLLGSSLPCSLVIVVFSGSGLGCFRVHASLRHLAPNQRRLCLSFLVAQQPRTRGDVSYTFTREVGIIINIIPCLVLILSLKSHHTPKPYPAKTLLHIPYYSNPYPLREPFSNYTPRSAGLVGPSGGGKSTVMDPWLTFAWKPQNSLAKEITLSHRA